jgi:hypothetical protein
MSALGGSGRAAPREEGRVLTHGRLWRSRSRFAPREAIPISTGPCRHEGGELRKIAYVLADPPRPTLPLNQIRIACGRPSEFLSQTPWCPHELRSAHYCHVRSCAERAGTQRANQEAGCKDHKCADHQGRDASCGTVDNSGCDPGLLVRNAHAFGVTIERALSGYRLAPPSPAAASPARRTPPSRDNDRARPAAPYSPG